MSTNAAAPLEQLLRTLVGRPHEFDQVTLDPTEPSPIVPELRGAEVDELLRDAQYEVLIDGNRVDYGGKQVWSQLHLTINGLRWLGEWPPPALEHHAGPWEDGYFGTIVKPVLAGLRDNPPRHGLVIAPVWGMPEDRFERWRALRLLLDAGLIDARLSDDRGSLNDIRLTIAGRNALDPSERDALDTAVRKLRIGAKIEAIIIAVEKALAPRLKELAEAAGVPITDETGRPRKLANVNDRLKQAGVITEAERTTVESMLKRRNDCGHGRDELVSYAQVDVVIAEARVFLEEHPAPAD